MDIYPPVCVRSVVYIWLLAAASIRLSAMYVHYIYVRECLETDKASSFGTGH